MAGNRLQWWVVKAIQTAVILGLALLATATPGSPSKEGGGGGPPFAGGISGNWLAGSNFNEEYKYGIVPASKGDTDDPESVCSIATAQQPNFADRVAAVVDAGMEAHAFWFLVSYEYALSICDWTSTPYLWGQQQGAMFGVLVSSLGLSADIEQMLGDVEITETSPFPCTVNGEVNEEPDAARWQCDDSQDKVNNRKVIEGFMDWMAFVASGINYTGVYTNLRWTEIVGPDVGPDEVDTNYVWMASHGLPSEAALATQTGFFTGLGFYIWSWQYSTDDCETSFGTAKRWAEGSSVYIPGWDTWTNSPTGDPEETATLCPRST